MFQALLYEAKHTESLKKQEELPINGWATIEGLPFSHGVTWIEKEQAYNFALYSKHAERVTLQEGRIAQWKRVIDTGLESPDDFRDPGKEVPLMSQVYLVKSRSVVVLSRPGE